MKVKGKLPLRTNPKKTSHRHCPTLILLLEKKVTPGRMRERCASLPT
jgi:hypothetical protein